MFFLSFDHTIHANCCDNWNSINWPPYGYNLYLFDFEQLHNITNNCQVKTFICFFSSLWVFPGIFWSILCIQTIVNGWSIHQDFQYFSSQLHTRDFEIFHLNLFATLSLPWKYIKWCCILPGYDTVELAGLAPPQQRWAPERVLSLCPETHWMGHVLDA